MAKTKSQLLEEASTLGLELTEKNTVAEITEAINQAKDNKDTEVDTDVSNNDSESETDQDDESKEAFTKAGKRSHKAVKEAEAEAERKARKEAGDTTPQDGAVANIEKGPAPKTRPLVERKGKAYRKAVKLVEKGKVYDLADAIKLATETSVTKFDSTVEIHVRLGVDPRQADQNIRSTVSLPNGTGKKVRVAALVANDDVDAVKEAGADFAGESEVIAMLSKEDLKFDVLVATPQFMAQLGKFARLLGPRGLMPNPKAGTVSANPVQAVKEAKAGKVEFRVDKQGSVHLGIGKVSFGEEKLQENASVFIKTLKSLRPNSLKGNYIISASIATTMGPGIKVNLD